MTRLLRPRVEGFPTDLHRILHVDLRIARLDNRPIVHSNIRRSKQYYATVYVPVLRHAENGHQRFT